MENTNQMLKNRTTCVYGFEKEPTFMQKLVLVVLLLMCFMISQLMEVEFVYHLCEKIKVFKKEKSTACLSLFAGSSE